MGLDDVPVALQIALRFQRAELGFELRCRECRFVFVLGFAGLRIAARSTNKFLGYAAVGMTAWIVVQAMINIFVVMRLLPVVGVPLPFLSQGGSALLANLIAVGVLLSAARQEPGAARLLASGPKARQPRLISVIDAPRGRN